MTLSKVIVLVSHVPFTDNHFSSQIKRQNWGSVKILKVVRSLRVLECNCYLNEMLWNIDYWVWWLHKRSHIPHLAWAGVWSFFQSPYSAQSLWTDVRRTEVILWNDPSAHPSLQQTGIGAGSLCGRLQSCARLYFWGINEATFEL